MEYSASANWLATRYALLRPSKVVALEECSRGLSNEITASSTVTKLGILEPGATYS